MPIRQLTLEQEEQLRQLQQLPRAALTIEQQRQRMLLESIRTAEQAAKKAALLSVIRSNPTAPPEDIALKAAVLYKQLKSSLTAPKALEQILAQEPNAQVRRAMATAVAEHTGSPSLLRRVGSALMWPLRAWGWLQTHTTGRIWTGIKSLQEGEGFWKGFLHPEEYEEPIFSEEELPESWSPFAKKAVSLVTEIAGSILTDPLTYIGIGKVADIARAGRWVRKGADVAEEAAKAAKTLEAARSAAITAQKEMLQEGPLWKTLYKALFGKADDAAKVLAQQDEVFKTIASLTDEVKATRKTVTSLLRKGNAPQELRQEVRSLLSDVSKEIRKLAKKGLELSPEDITAATANVTNKLSTVNERVAKIVSDIATQKVASKYDVNTITNLLEAIPSKFQQIRNSVLSGGTTADTFKAVDAVLDDVNKASKSLRRLSQHLEKLTGTSVEGMDDVTKALNRIRTNVRMLKSPKVYMNDAEFTKRLTQLSEDVAKVVDTQIKAANKLEGAFYQRLNVTTGIADKLTSAQKMFTTLTDTLNKRIEETFGAVQKAFEDYQKAAEALKPRWTLTLRVPLTRKELVLADLQPLFERAQRVAASVQMYPGIRPVAEFITKHFRVLSPVPRAGMSTSEFLQLSKDIPELAHMMRAVKGRSEYAAIETLSKFIEQIPDKKVAELVTRVAQYRDDAVKVAEILANVTPEVKQMVLDGVAFYGKALDDITKRLQETFKGFSGYFDELLTNYVSIIIYNTPDERRKILEKFLGSHEGLVERLAADPTYVGRVIVERAKGAAEGSSPYFLRKRIFKTLEAAEKAGFTVEKDIRVIFSTYVGVAEQLLQLKNIEDWLHLQQYIQPMSKVKKLGWERADKIFPWLKGKNLAMHPEVVRLFNNLRGTILPATDMGEDLAKFARAFDSVTAFFKGAVTSARPSFHIKNLMGNLLLMRMAGVPYLEQADAMRKAISVMVGKHPQAKEIMAEFMKHGLQGQTIFADFSVMPARLAKHLTDILEAQTGGLTAKIKTIVFPRTARGVEKIFAGARWVGEQVDTMSRLAAFIHFMEKGMTPDQAARLVRETLFDYGLLTRTERTLRRYVVPFYTWVRNALPRSLSALLMQPGAIGGYEHIVNAFNKVLAPTVNRAQLPAWLQDAILLGTDEDGGVLFIQPSPPWEEFFNLLAGNAVAQWLGETRGEEVEPTRELAGMIHPMWSAVWTLLTGVDPRTGKKYPEETISNVPEQLVRLGAAIKQFLPWSEVERAFPKLAGRPRTTTTPFLGSPVVRYDLPYATAVDVKKASSLLDEVMQKLEAETGAPLPTTADVSQAERLIDRYSNYVRLIREAQSDPWKAQFINALIQGYTSPVAAMEVLQDNADLLLGSRAEVVMRLRKLLTPENFAKLRVYLGRMPSLKDFFEHRTALESGTLEAVSPEQRRAQALLEELERIRTYGQALQ